MKRAKKHLVHGIANCCDCSWEYQDGGNKRYYARARAREHHRKTGHMVTVEVAYFIEYRAK